MSAKERKNQILGITPKDLSLFVVGAVFDLLLAVMFVFVAWSWNSKQVSLEFVSVVRAIIFTLLGLKGVDKALKCKDKEGEVRDRYPGVLFALFDMSLYVVIYALHFFGWAPSMPENLFWSALISGLIFCSTKGFDIWGFLASKMPLFSKALRMI